MAGVSGGADSVCLLLVLSELKKEIPFTLFVVHVNHLIRQEAGEDALFVQKLCRDLDVPFYLVEKDVEAIARKQGISTEEAGRQVRYEAFEAVLTKWQSQTDDAARQMQAATGIEAQTSAAAAVGTVAEAAPYKIAVAHNLNDRAETMLFNLFRGTGLNGLGSIRPVRNGSGSPMIIRPLLCITRSQIEDFLTAKGMGWCIDSTNAEDTYTRNRIRHHILPFAEKEVAGGAIANMGRAADILAETEDYIRQETGKAYQACRVSSQSLSVTAFLTCHPLLQKQIILRSLEELTPAKRDITYVHVEDVRDLFLKQGNRQVQLPYGIIVRREYDKVVFEKGSKQTGKPAVKDSLQNSAAAQNEKQGNPVQHDRIEVPLPEIGGNPVSIPLSKTLTMELTVFNCEKTVNIPQNQYTKWFDYDKIEKPLAVRTRKQGDFLAFNAAFSKKTIQDYMVEEKIPARERDSILLLAEDSHILWVTGHRISSYYKISDTTKYILQVQLRGGQ